MTVGLTDFRSILGIPLFLLDLLLLALFLLSWLPDRAEKRRFLWLVIGLALLSLILAEAGTMLLGWSPPWLVEGVISPPASLADLIALPVIAFVGLGVWFGLSVLAITPARAKLKITLEPVNPV